MEPKRRTINTRTTRKKNSKNGTSGGIIKKKPSSRKTPMPVRPEGETIEQQQKPDKIATTMSEPENMQTESKEQMQEPQTGNKRGREIVQEGDVSLSSSPPLQQQKVEDSANMSLPPPPSGPSGEELGLGALPPLEAQDSANISLSPSSVESGAGAAEAQVPGAVAPLPLEEVGNLEDVSLPQSAADDAQSKLGAPPPLLAPEMLEQEKVEESVKPVADAESADAESADAELADAELADAELATGAESADAESADAELAAVKLSLLKVTKDLQNKLDKINLELAAAPLLAPEMKAVTARVVGGGMKKRKKTFYKRYKSKKSMKRKNKTNRNK